MKLVQAQKVVSDPNAEIDRYIENHSQPEPEYLAEVVRETHLQMINPRMMSGHLQGRLLKMLVQLSGAHRIIEIGTFSGYSALCMAEGLPNDGELYTIEIDDEQEDFIQSQLDRVEWGGRVHLCIGDGLEVIPKLEGEFDMAFIDADKRLYQQYFELLLPRMRRGGLILADNTLWDGKVLIEKPHSNDYQTIAIKEFNDRLAIDDRVEKIILPMRDGLTMMRVK